MNSISRGVGNRGRIVERIEISGTRSCGRRRRRKKRRAGEKESEGWEIRERNGGERRSAKQRQRGQSVTNVRCRVARVRRYCGSSPIERRLETRRGH